MLYPSPLGPPRAWNDTLSYYGNTKISVTSINMGGSIECRSTSGTAPFSLMCSAANVTCVGSRIGNTRALNPFTDLQHVFSIEKAGGAGRCEYGDEIVHPRLNAIIDPYIQTSGEATFLIREAGSYTLTLTTTGLDSSGDPISNTITETITVTEPSVDRVFIDALGGDNANDGNDPHGFALTAGAYTESTKALVEVGAFASYDHVAATAGVSTNHFNFIYIDGFGLQKIASKTSDDEIVLVDGLGSDQTGLTSSDGPLVSYAGGFANNTWYYYRSNQGVSTYEIDTAFETRNKTGEPAVIGYDGERVEILPAASAPSRLVSFFASSSSTSSPKVIISNVHLNGDNRSQVVGGASTSTQTFNMDIILDRVTGEKANAQIGMLFQNTGANAHYDVTLWAVDVINRFNSDSRRHAIYNQDVPAARFRMIGGSLSTDSDSAVLDHFHYENGSGDHAHIAFVRYYDGDNCNYCLNINMKDAGERRYYWVNGCYADGDVNWFTDHSYTNNDPAVAWFRDSVFQDNYAETNDGFMLSYCAKDYAAYDNIYVSPTPDRGMFLAGDSVNHVDSEFYYTLTRNKTYGSGIEENRYGDARAVFDNYVYNTASDAEVIEITGTTIAGNDIYYDNNVLYAPNDTDGDTILDRDTFTYISVSTFDSTYTFTNVTTDPAYLDPINRDFRTVNPDALTLNVSGIPDGTYVAVAYRENSSGDAEALFEGTLTFIGEESQVIVSADSGDKVYTVISNPDEAPKAIAENEVS